MSGSFLGTCAVVSSQEINPVLARILMLPGCFKGRRVCDVDAVY